MKLAFLGDTAFFGKFSTLNNNKNDVLRRFDCVKNVLADFDFVIANLETPLTESDKVCGGKSAYIRGVPEDAEILKHIGVTHVSLANNHVFDFRKKGFEDTLATLKEAGIKYFGVNGIKCIEEYEGNRICLRGYCCYSTNARGFAENTDYGVNVLDFTDTQNALKEDKENNLLSILSVHWGQEHVNYPNHYHMDFARSLAKEYDFLLHGHHPHVVQGIERVNNSLIAYSLGNFCFDDIYTKKSKEPLVKLSKNNRTAFIWSVEVENNKIINSECIPLYIGEDGIELTENGDFEANMMEYSEYLNADKYEYIGRRQGLLNKYLSSRKKMRDLNWYLKRLNLESFKMIRNARNNSKFYNSHIVNQLPKEEMPFVRDSVLLLGNFDIINLNAAGRRVVGAGKIFKELGFEPVFVSINKFVDNNVLNNFTVRNRFYTYALKASLSTMDWLRVKETYQNYVNVINEIGIDNLKYIYIYGSPVISLAMRRIIKYAKKHHIPVIGDAVDWIEHTSGGTLKNIIKYIDVNYKQRYLYNKTDGMVVISSYLKKYYEGCGRKTFILPPVGDFEPQALASEEHDTFRLVYAGIPFAGIPNIEKSLMKDRLDLIIGLVSKLNENGTDTVLNIYGIDKDYYLTSVPEHTDLLEKLSGCVRFNGLVPNDEIKQEIRKADATVLIRDVTVVTQAGFPTKVAESLCMGTPVITNATSDIAEYVKSGYNGVIIDSDPELAAEQVIEHFILDGKKAEIKKKCMESSPFDYRNFVDGMKDFLDKI